MKIRVLGCSGTEMPGHRLSGFLINTDTLLDAGTAASVLSLEEQMRISYIILSHSHLDHIKDIPLLADNLIGKRNKAIELISHPNVLQDLNSYLLNNAIWPDFTMIPIEKPILRFRPIHLEESTKVGGLEINAFEVNHSVFALGYLISDGRGSIFYTGDVGVGIGNVFKKVAGVNLKAIIVEVSFSDKQERLARVSGHLTPFLLGEGLKEFNKKDIPVYISHIKHSHVKQGEIEVELKRIGYPSIRPLKDGEILEI